MAYAQIISDEVAAKLNAQENIEVIDVREQDEWNSEHIPQAKHIPLGQLPNRMSELDPSKEYVMVCRSGARSGRACDFLSANGFKVTNMIGGMLGWNGEVKLGQ